MYDITIVGAGVSGIFLAYTLLQTQTKFKILMIEKGRNLIDRICPIESGSSDKCINCKICNKTQGFGGMGRSEGKFNYTNDFGGNLGKKIGSENAIELMEAVDKILCSFGADKVNMYNTENEELKNRAKQNNCSILTTKVRHLGTGLSHEILNKMYLYLNDKVDIEFEKDIISIDKDNNIFNLHDKNNIFKSKEVVIATGISGGDEFLRYCNGFDVKLDKVRVDLGIRVEMKLNQLEYILEKSKETKIRYKEDEYEATTYCMNPKGKVIKKYQEGLVMADGQNHLETDSPSDNINFSIFVPKYFSSYNDASEYTKEIIESINREKERIVVQRFEDLINNRLTKKEQLDKNSIEVTLEAEGGNLYDEIPKVYIDAVIKIFELMENITGKKIHKDTLLYGIDSKLYQPKIITNEEFETKEGGLYIIGDCSGTTYSLSQAAASGVYLGRCILEKYINKQRCDNE